MVANLRRNAEYPVIIAPGDSVRAKFLGADAGQQVFYVNEIDDVREMSGYLIFQGVRINDKGQVIGDGCGPRHTRDLDSGLQHLARSVL